MPIIVWASWWLSFVLRPWAVDFISNFLLFSRMALVVTDKQQRIILNLEADPRRSMISKRKFLNGHRGNQFTAPVGVFFVYESSFGQYSMEIERGDRVRIHVQYTLGRQAQFLNLFLNLLTPHWIWMSYRPMSLAFFLHRFPSIA